MDRNFILAIALSMGVIILWEALVAGPQREAMEAARRAAGEQTEQATPGEAADFGAVIGTRPAVTIEEALAAAPRRIPVETPSLVGSINLAGARIDDLRLKNYRETVEPDSPMIRLLSPEATEHGHFVQQGWFVGSASDRTALWSAPEGAQLTPETPVTLTRRAGGLVFEKTIAVDEKFMFTVSQTVRNEGGEPATITPYGLVVQRGVPNNLQNFMILHEGPIAVIGKALYERKYKKAISNEIRAEGDQGWVGITNKYWLAAAIPPQGERFNAVMRNVGGPERPVFQASYALSPRTLAPGETATLTSYLFGGAKDVDILRSYEKPPEKGGLGIARFDSAVDWGKFFYWATRPIFTVLDFLGDRTGNFGVAILLLTLIIKILLFPLANKAYEMTAKMKKLQPQLEQLKARYGDDKMKLQQEMMALYQKEKLNPVTGCLPIFVQMPIFYALYKTLFVTIELRHEPFILWIRDLSAPDPTTIFNLFGLLPYDPTALPLIGAFLGVGVLPLLMGVAMWFQMKLNPPPADPIQAQVFALMPIIFTFLFASFAAGLVLYWFWNTLLSIGQQWIIMKRNGVEVDIAANLGLSRFAKKTPPAAGK
ncbi:membrane protein insertase YidC [Amphiplicatus metriothermophilus]|uniref:Membrane protein insertase YidC n=1 Tax=Amphiplicatus metriothermophilus TaxID=1519374 RepID=A0A239PIK2_9PROT|nr:membrane protein insertase YidC [Amphiplicatus metriothermophilus]MBB5518050.1 YidC/Oxa1 family membrane protein insertase [Amphiplicatus metriothermophilus]SNT67616.1 protein translocase subunit yidC [Amphiplicatus metriothermophilus]